MRAKRDTAAQTTQKPAHGEEHSDAALGHPSQNKSSPERATEGGELPKGWGWKSLAELAADGVPILYGVLQPGPDTPGGVPYVRPTEIVEDVIDLSSIRRTTPAIAGKYKRSVLKPDDIILSIVGTIGKVAVVPPELDGGNITQSSVRVRPRFEIVSPRYVAWVLRSPVLRRQFDKHRLGTAVPRLNVAHVRALRVPVPPLPEQRRIVAEIEKQFTRLEVGVAALRRVQANLKRYRAAVLKAACEGKLVPTEAELSPSQHSTKNLQPAYETGEALLARILTERRQNWRGRGQYKEPAAAKLAEVSSLPKGWTYATVEQLTSLVATGATPYRGKPAYWEGGTFAWITSGALNDKAVNSAKEFITPLAIVETNAKLFPPGTLLVALYGEGKTRGMVSELRIEAATNQACAALLFDEFNSGLKSFLRVFLLKNYNDVRLLSSGGVQPNLSLAIVKQTKIPLPPLAEQARIVAEVERRLSVVEEFESVVTASLQRATRLRQSILQKAFTGEL